MIKEFVKMLGVPLDAAEDAIKCEKMAKSVLTRRYLFTGTAALVAGTVFSFPAPVNYIWMAIDGWVPNPLAGPTKYNGGVALIKVNEKYLHGRGGSSDTAFLSFRAPSPEELMILAFQYTKALRWVNREGKLVSILNHIVLT